MISQAHPRRFYYGLDAEKESALTEANLPEGTLFFAQDTLKMYFLDNLKAWHEIVDADALTNAVTFFESLTFEELALDPDPPAPGYWKVYHKDDGLYIRSELGDVYGPYVHSLANVGAGISLVAPRVDGEIRVKSLVEGDNVNITDSGTSLRLDVSGAVLGANVGAGGGALIFRNVTGGNQLNFRGVLGLDGIATSTNLTDDEVEARLATDTLDVLSDPLNEQDEYVPIYRPSLGYHEKVTLAEFQKRQYYYGWKEHTLGVPIDYALSTASTWYSLFDVPSGTMNMQTVYEEGYTWNLSNLIEPPDYPVLNKVTINLFGNFDWRCEIGIEVGGVLQDSIKAYIGEADGTHWITLHGFFETTGFTDYINLVAMSPNGSPDAIEIYNMNVLIERYADL